MNAGGLSQRIVDLPMKLVGHRPGGLGYVGVLAAMIMASLSGSAVADTAAVAALLVPMMRQANYPVNRAAGLIGSGGIIAAIIPPSIPLIIFGVSSGLSISKLFMAGIAPGIMMGVTLMVTWWWQAKRLNLPCQPKASLREVWQSLVSGIWALFSPIIIIGGFRLGLFTPTEAGAVAAFYALFVSVVVYREMTFSTLYHVLIKPGKNHIRGDVPGGLCCGICMAYYDRPITHDGYIRSHHNRWLIRLAYYSSSLCSLLW